MSCVQRAHSEVRSNTSALLVLLTKQLPARVWSVGEITAAHLNGVPLIPLALPNFQGIDNSPAARRAPRLDPRSCILCKL